MCRAILGIEDGWLYESETAADPIGVGSPTWYECKEATIFINHLADLPEDVILVLNDYHTIHNSGVHVLLDLLIKQLRPQMHMVIATRFDPPLPLAKLRSERQLNLSPRPFIGVQRTTPFAVYCRSPIPGVPETPFMGVQRAKPFAGVRGSPTPGVPETPLFPIFAAAGGQSKKSEKQENPVQEKSIGERVEGGA